MRFIRAFGPTVLMLAVLAGCAGGAGPSGLGSGLQGRTMGVSSVADLKKLHHKEVVLTFDDGPLGGKTDSILKTLNSHGVKATFFMVGRMATARPDLVRKVAAGGHTIGSHTYSHPNLAARSFASAVGDIERGEKAIAQAGGGTPRLFRFPYLAHTGRLRQHLAKEGVVVADVDVDSFDYLSGSPGRVVGRIMSRLRKRGRGVILMHDIQGRTAAALPSLLTQLKKEGYKVVHIRPGFGGFSLASTGSGANGAKTDRSVIDR